jgi:hypothetical protein
MVTVGLNLHRRYITACAVDDTGGVLAEARRLDPTLDVRQRTVMLNRIHACLTAENLRCPELDLYTRAGAGPAGECGPPGPKPRHADRRAFGPPAAGLDREARTT